MMPVDQFIKQTRINKYNDEFIVFKQRRIHPNPLFAIDETVTPEEEETEVCPCCVDRSDDGRKKSLVSATKIKTKA